jgi:hypothetical protein
MRQTLAIVIFLCSPVLLSASLITNGDFESGNFSGWTHSGFANAICSPGFGHSSDCAADLDGSDGVVSQVITTVAGDSYTFDFWYLPEAEQFSVKWDGQVVFSTGSASGIWTHKILADLTATTASTTVEFDATVFSTPPMRLDDVNVVDTTPEPSTGLLLLAPAAALLWLRRKRV